MTKLETYLTTLFWKQNSYHQHGIIVHTLRVTWELYKAGHISMVPAGLLHDIGKHLSAHQKPEDIINNEFSFTDHEEISWLVIKDWPFVSKYTKDLVRWHYLIRRMGKAKQKGLAEYDELKKTWDSFTPEFQEDLAKFLKCDDLGKGKVKKK